MSATDSEAPGFDIGVPDRAAQESLPSGSHRRTRRRNRSLPTWVAVALAVVVGWLLGAVMTGGSETVQPIEPEPEDTQVAAPTLSPVIAEDIDAGQIEDVPIASESVEEAASDVTTVVLLLAPIRGIAIPADLRVISQGVATEVELDRSVSGSTPGVIGQLGGRILTAGNHVVFMALDSVMVFDPVLMSEPVEVAQAIYLLPGSDAGSVWAVGSGSQTVREVDVADDVVGPLHDLGDIGTPLASFSGGLVLAPNDAALGSIALWSPLRGLEPLTFADDFDFIDAGGNTLVLEGPNGLAAYDTVTDKLTRTNRNLESSERHRAIVSPDGQRIAIVQRGIITELPVVVVVDTGSGATVDQFEVAYEWQLQWVGPRDLLFAIPAGEAVGLRIRNTSQQTSRLVTELVTPNYLVTTFPSERSSS